MGQDIPTLFKQSGCYDCYASLPGVAQLLKLGLLRDILLSLNPNAMTDPQSLLNSAACYQCYASQAWLLELSLLDQIATNIDNTVAAQTGVFSGVVDPAFNPGVGSAVYYRTDNKKVWLWDGVAWNLIIS